MENNNLKKNNDYFKQRNIDSLKKIRKIQEELPLFCNEYFIGIEHKTSVLTRLNYAYDLRIFFYYLINFQPAFSDVDGPQSFTIEHLRRVTTTHLEMYTDFLSYYEYNGKIYTNENKGKARKLSSVRAMFRYFYNKEYLPSDVSAKISMPKIRDKEIIKLESDEVEDILNVAENGSSSLTKHQEAYHEMTHLRDTALLTLFLGTGIRISECVGLNVNDIDFNVNGFTITRKGGARVILYFSDEVASALKAYLKEREANKSVPKDEQALFLSIQNKRLSVRAIQNIVQKYSRIVTPLKKISPHKLRSTYATRLYHETEDIYLVADALGHSDVNTTRKHYAAMSDQRRREAAQNVHLPEMEPEEKTNEANAEKNAAEMSEIRP